MDPLATVTHADVPREAFAAALVLCRISAAVSVLPALGEASLPMTVRASISATAANGPQNRVNTAILLTLASPDYLTAK